MVASLVRLREQFKVDDPDFTCTIAQGLGKEKFCLLMTMLTGAMNGTVIWTSIEPCVAVICACLPTLRPLALRFFPRLSSQVPRNISPRGQNYYKSLGRSRGSMGRALALVRPHGFHKEGLVTTVSMENQSSGSHNNNVPLENIVVTKDVRMTSERI